MQKDPRVLNITRGFRLRFNQACKAVENCACAWVDVGVSIRDLTLAESIAARARQAKDREPLPYSEIHGLKFEAPLGGDVAYRQGRVLAYEASLFVEDMAARGMSA
jgi:hypothetical protein